MRKLAIILAVATLLAILAGICGCSPWYDIKQESRGGEVPVSLTEVKAEGTPWGGRPPMPEVASGYAESTEVKTGGVTHDVSSSGLWILYPIGGLAVLAGAIVGVFFKARKTGIALAVVGGGLIAAARFLENPIIVWILFLVALLAGVVWLVFATRAGKKIREALGFERKITDQIIVGVQRVKAGVISGEKPDVVAALQGAQDLDVQKEVIRRKADLTI